MGKKRREEKTANLKNLTMSGGVDVDEFIGVSKDIVYLKYRCLDKVFFYY